MTEQIRHDCFLQCQRHGVRAQTNYISHGWLEI